MSKGTKRQKKLEEFMGSSSTGKRKRVDNDDSIGDKQTNEKTSIATSSVTIIAEDDLSILRQFDLDMTFGPCTGIPRLDRYERALRHGLEPPIRVLELINLYPRDRQITHCIWRDYTL